MTQISLTTQWSGLTTIVVLCHKIKSQGTTLHHQEHSTLPIPQDRSENYAAEHSCADFRLPYYRD